MSKFQKRIDSKMRINELEKVFINTIEDFSNKNLDLTMNEVAAVMLKMLTQANDSEIKEAITQFYFIVYNTKIRKRFNASYQRFNVGS